LYKDDDWLICKTDDRYLFSIISKGDGKTAILTEYYRHSDHIQITLNREIYSRGVQDYLSSHFIFPSDKMVFVYLLSGLNGVILHSAGLSFAEGTFVLPGISGTGKSTISMILERYSQFRILSDDRIIVRKNGESFHAYGTPWCGEHGIVRNKSGPLKGIFFLHQAERSFIKEIRLSEALKQLIPVTSIPWYDRETADRVLDTCEMLITELPAFELHFRPDETVLREIETALRKLG